MNRTIWVGDVVDLHAYPGPGTPPLEKGRTAVLGEFGGLGLPLDGHTWLDKGNWGYRSYTTQPDLNAAYLNLLGQLRLHAGDGLAAAIYTQTTDVEIEVNGVMTYDTRIYVNGTLIAELPGANPAYAYLPLSGAALRPGRSGRGRT